MPASSRRRPARARSSGSSGPTIGGTRRATGRADRVAAGSRTRSGSGPGRRRAVRAHLRAARAGRGRAAARRSNGSWSCERPRVVVEEVLLELVEDQEGLAVGRRKRRVDRPLVEHVDLRVRSRLAQLPRRRPRAGSSSCRRRSARRGPSASTRAGSRRSPRSRARGRRRAARRAPSPRTVRDPCTG